MTQTIQNPAEPLGGWLKAKGQEAWTQTGQNFPTGVTLK